MNIHQPSHLGHLRKGLQQQVSPTTTRIMRKQPNASLSQFVNAQVALHSLQPGMSGKACSGSPYEVIVASLKLLAVAA